jgi:SAM-dependent methyltransferase
MANSEFHREKYPYTWAESVDLLRKDPVHRSLIHDAYLTADIIDNCNRFAASEEFRAVLSIIREQSPHASAILDIPGGNGIATFAFAKSGFVVTSVEPDPSSSVGRGAIETVLKSSALQASVVDALGENLPFANASFDVVYVRQGLHHAQDLPAMVAEYFRVLRPNGILLATREHVVDNYGTSLQTFLDAQVDHQLYGGEHAFTLPDYRSAITRAGFSPVLELGPYESPINMHPNTPAILRERILASGAGRFMRIVLSDDLVERIGKWWLEKSRRPGRLYTFVARKIQTDLSP